MSKKNKIASNKNNSKVKREDDEEDAQIMEDKMSVIASLGGNHSLTIYISRGVTHVAISL